MPFRVVVRGAIVIVIIFLLFKAVKMLGNSGGKPIGDPTTQGLARVLDRVQPVDFVLAMDARGRRLQGVVIDVDRLVLLRRECSELGLLSLEQLVEVLDVVHLGDLPDLPRHVPEHHRRLLLVILLFIELFASQLTRMEHVDGALADVVVDEVVPCGHLGKHVPEHVRSHLKIRLKFVAFLLDDMNGVLGAYIEFAKVEETSVEPS